MSQAKRTTRRQSQVTTDESGPPGRTCGRCVFGLRPSARQCYVGMMGGWPAPTTCMNHPDSPGVPRSVGPQSTCRNFRARREPPVRVAPPEPPNDEVRYIALTKGKFAIVDAADFEWLNRHKWYYCVTPGGGAYAARRSKGTNLLMHRVIMQTPKGMVVDHINHNGVDNRRANLRNCTTMQNTWNSKPEKGATSPYKGVSWCKAMRQWEVAITVKGQRTQIGFFDDEIEAAKAYDRVARQHFGQYAYLNFPEELET